LQRHEYRSISQLSKDFYELLNNGRTVTSPDAQTWIDSLLLAELYEELNERSLVKALPEYYSMHYTDSEELEDKGGGGGGGIRVYWDDQHASTSSSSSSSSTPSTSYPSDACAMLCGFCNIPHRVTGWPNLALTAAAPIIRTASDRRSSNRNESKMSKSKAAEKFKQLSNAKRKKVEKYVLTSEDEKLPYSWAINQMLKSSNTVFTNNEGSSLAKIPMDRREATEKKWAAEWDQAATFLKKKDKEKEKEGRNESSSDPDSPSLSGDGDHSESSFLWLCPACVHPSTAHRGDAHLPQKVPRPPPSYLLNRVVKVWWLDDEMYYRGTVNAFDETSGERHCTALHCTVLQCTVLHFSALHCSTSIQLDSLFVTPTTRLTQLTSAVLILLTRQTQSPL
jgi:hypothetical protein